MVAASSSSASLGRGGDSHRGTIPAEASPALHHATRLELLAIDPSEARGKPDEGFHGWDGLGRLMLLARAGDRIVPRPKEGGPGDLLPAQGFTYRAARG